MPGKKQNAINGLLLALSTMEHEIEPEAKLLSWQQDSTVIVSYLRYITGASFNDTPIFQ